MSDEFEKCAWAYEHSQADPVGPRNKQAQLYGLFKQARVGDINIDQPGFFNFEDRAKYEAWKANEGMPDEEAKRRFLELAKAMGYADPGPSPVPWISDETWRREESWGMPDYSKKHRALADARPMEAVDFDREIAPKVATSNGDNLSPTGTLEEQRARLDSPPDSRSLRLFGPIWPVCCDRLSTLVGHRGMDEVFGAVLADTHHLRAAIIDDHNLDPELEKDQKIIRKRTRRTYGESYLKLGNALYHCGHCGSVFIAAYEE